MALVDSAGFDAEALAKGVELSDYGLKPGDLTELKRLFEHATTFGSLIQVPEGLASKLAGAEAAERGDQPGPLCVGGAQALGAAGAAGELLAAQYDAVVANPPYMGSKYHVAALKEFLKDQYAEVKSDLFSAFVVRCSAMGMPDARVGVMSPNVWMYLSSHEKLRTFISSRRTMTSLVELPLSGFKGATVQICSFIFRNKHLVNAKGSFIRLVDFRGGDTEMASYTRQAIGDANCGWFFETSQDEFKKIPGSPVAYWVGDRIREQFGENTPFEEFAKPRIGMRTGNNDRFLRRWFEIDLGSSNFQAADAADAAHSKKKWFPYQKGGSFRKWSGNLEYVVNWFNDGDEVKTETLKNYPQLTRDNLGWKISNEQLYFNESLTWTATSSSYFAARLAPPGCLFDVKGSFAVPPQTHIPACLGFLCSPVVQYLVKCLNPTVETQPRDLAVLPFYNQAVERSEAAIHQGAVELVDCAAADWKAYERSWDFQSLPLLTASSEPTPTLESSYTAWITQNRGTIAEMKRLEEENNRLFIDAYGLADELTPDVPIEQITLTVNPAYRYGGKLTEEEQWTRFRQDTMEELVSYAIGCMMGRYSLDAPGLIIADSRDNPDAHMAAYSEKVGKPMEALKFQPDDDGIIPVLDDEWFEDDVVERFKVFLRAAFGNESLEENLRFLEEAIGKKIRKYFVNDFYKAHLQTYKKRPIYWLLSKPQEELPGSGLPAPL